MIYTGTDVSHGKKRRDFGDNKNETQIIVERIKTGTNKTGREIGKRDHSLRSSNCIMCVPLCHSMMITGVGVGGVCRRISGLRVSPGTVDHHRSQIADILVAVTITLPCEGFRTG